MYYTQKFIELVRAKKVRSTRYDFLPEAVKEAIDKGPGKKETPAYLVYFLGELAANKKVPTLSDSLSGGRALNETFLWTKIGQNVFNINRTGIVGYWRNRITIEGKDRDFTPDEKNIFQDRNIKNSYLMTVMEYNNALQNGKCPVFVGIAEFLSGLDAKKDYSKIKMKP